MKSNSEREVDGHLVTDITPRALAKARVNSRYYLLLALVLGGCSLAPPPADNAAALREIASRDSGAELVVEGPVVSVLPSSAGPSGVHEHFVLGVSSGNATVQLFVADNVSVGSAAPLHVGDRVTVKGELDFNDFGPVLHWTHRDPSMRHQPGFVEVGGRIYE
jgi:Protein of unknown function (DUF3465)